MASNRITGVAKMTTPEKWADGAAVGSLLTFLGLSLAEWETIIHIFAGLAAIIAGLAAAAFHIYRIIHLGRD